MRISDCKIGDLVKIKNNGTWRLEQLRDTRRNKLNPDTIRRHPERLRSRYCAMLRNVVTGMIRWSYFAEHIVCRKVKAR